MLRCRSLLVDAILSATSAPVQIGAFTRPDVVVSRLKVGQIVAPVQNLHNWRWPHRHKRRRQVENEPMNDAAWWARVVQARTERDDLRPQRVWTLHKGEHATAIDFKAVPGVAARSSSPSTASGGRRGCSGHTSRPNLAARPRTRGRLEGNAWTE
jgi:hypothetical protein